MNLFDHIPRYQPDEIFETLLQSDSIKIERIISHGHSSPTASWYDQKENEWVVVLAGSAQIEYPDGTTILLNRGDTLHLQAHQKHRVAWTDPETPTIWLAVFYK